MPYLQTDFPFCAVQGQVQFKKALILAAINPAIGGVLVSGPRGSAKSTLARALANVLPKINQQPSPFVTLPLAASLEMLTGTLDLDKVLKSQELVFSPGLLSKVDGGVLYVDEVNLLPDHLIDQLLDVAASGVNRIERDGISHAHASVFSLIGTMNPDEGELRAQLTDRFGLMVNLGGQLTLAQRVEIVRAREAFDADPQGFTHHYHEQQQQLANSIDVARERLAQISCTENLRIEIAQRCQQAAVEGVRADIVMYRAAIAHCAWRLASEVAIEDIDAVEELVLAHRRTATSNSQGGPSDTDGQSSGSASNESPQKKDQSANGHSFRRPTEKNSSLNSSAETQAGNSDLSTSAEPTEPEDSDWGAMPVRQNVVSSDENFSENAQALEQLLKAPKLFSHNNLSTQYHSGKRKGAARLSASNRSGLGQAGKAVDWFSTFRCSLTSWPKINLHYQRSPRVANTLHLLLLDTSASTLAQQLSARAKGCALAISKQAYLAREQLQILGFGNAQVSQILARVKAPKELRKILDSAQVGGGTPLREVLMQALKVLQSLKKSNRNIDVRCYLITDGRSRAQVNDLSLNVPCVLIDTESGGVKRGRGALIAAQLGAQYYSLQQSGAGL